MIQIKIVVESCKSRVNVISLFYLLLSPCFHVWRGSCTATPSPKHTTVSNTTYVKFPPHMSLARENANREAAAAGATMRCTATTVCASPFVAPRERLFGAAAAMNMNTESGREKETRQSV